MKLLCGSDFHGTVPKNLEETVKKEKPEAFLYAGDMAPHPWEEGSAAEVVDTLSNLDIPVYVVPGNVEDMDLLIVSDKATPTFNLIGMKRVDFAGYSIVGFSDVTLPLVFAFKSLRENMLESILKECKPEKTIVLNHVPPHDTRVDYATAWGFEEHAGDEALRKIIDKFQPLLVVCGHIHEAKGTDKIGKTLVVNTATALCVIELEEGKQPKTRFVE